jgi:AMMECR1 domain-containing protein
LETILVITYQILADEVVENLRTVNAGPQKKIAELQVNLHIIIYMSIYSALICLPNYILENGSRCKAFGISE